ncbi:preprotein translocase subunit YajC [bacterium (candidate division B38) B3_B38]|nr:MAG: preprotein translocase subunit YajC [bacterium (candidate division B38) B3_B38]
MSLSLFMMAQPQGGGAGWMGLLPLIIIFAIFYFLMISPMRRKQKRLQMLISNLKTGDKIITTGGVYGTIIGVSEDRIQLRITERVNIDLAKNAVAGLQPERK